MKLIKGIEGDLYRLYKDSDNVYHHFKGSVCDLRFKSKRWDRVINMSIGHYPTSNFKILN